MSEQGGLISVRVVLALVDEARELTVRVPSTASVRDALRAALRAGLSLEGVDFDVDNGPLGIHGRRVTDAEALLDGDRVELYRPLAQDPMSRRRRVAAGN
jgi:putative ubiquitin-RnfH superfamily antitoxin RatB of RatAB toxin-antitoxin module